MPRLSILVVEDDPLARKVMADHLCDHTVEFASDKDSAREKLRSNRPDLCFVDLKLGSEEGCSGLEIIPLAAARNIYTVVMSGHDADHYVEKAYGLGCNDFYAKGNEASNVEEVLSRFQRRRKYHHLDRIFEESFVTQDPETRAGVSEVLKYATSDLPVLILGPSGTGKTSLARIIHDHSGRSGDFVAINCSAQPEDLLEAELFGYAKGAFTGANGDRRGKLLLADNGTLFLDEIGSMSLKMQAKLLKAIEEKTFYPVGSERPETSRFRIISATLEDLQGLIKDGKLRFDFFQRIHGMTVSLKPLAGRKDDIFPLIARLTAGERKLSFSSDAKEQILRHGWPGNVRELKKFVELLAAGQEGRITGEGVERVLKTLSVEENGKFVSEDQYRFALQNGLEAAVNRFIDSIINRNLEKNAGIRRKVLADLGIATRLLYNSLERFNRRGMAEKNE